ncbi:MAG: hypothetical protein M3Y93_08985 [Pseudomonadota bacterium]|nr:hypothetical protein [Pseudomonadota bacterium]
MREDMRFPGKFQDQAQKLADRDDGFRWRKAISDDMLTASGSFRHQLALSDPVVSSHWGDSIGLIVAWQGLVLGVGKHPASGKRLACKKLMNAIISEISVVSSNLVAGQPVSPADSDAALEQQMAERGLSGETKRFLRQLHQAEKHLNDAFEKAHQGGALDRCVSELYHDLYCSDEAMLPAPR